MTEHDRAGFGAGQKVVVIDDTTEILDLIDALLTDEGFQVIICQEASAAINTVAAERPVLVIVDLRMAGVEHWELVDALIDDARTGRLPVLVCSAAAAELQAASARLQAQGGDVIVKPFDIEELIAKVRALIGVR